MLSAALGWYYGSNDEELLAECTFKNPYKSKVKSVLQKLNDIIVRPGVLGNGNNVNIFTEGKLKGKENSLEKCAQQLKVLRHPNIIHFIGCIIVDNEVHLITEHATPLYTVLQTLDANEICSGLHDIALALQFIHEKAHVTHNNVCLRNLYVDKNGVWKLGGFEYACKYNQVNEEFLNLNSNYPNIIPPEEKGSSKVKFPLKIEESHARDVFAFGILLKNFFEQIRFSTQISKENLTEIISDIMREDFESRPNFNEVVSMSIFRSCYIDVVHFLQTVTLKTKQEKENFFRTFLKMISDNNIFADVIGRRIIPLLLTPIILAEQAAVEFVINPILTPASSNSSQGILPEEIFALHVVPCILELFSSRLVHVRVVLVNNFHKYVHLFERSVLDQVVLPEILVGLTDLNNEVVRSSLHALADAVPIVGGDLIVGGEREKIFSLGIPKFDGRALNISTSIATKTVQKMKRKPLPKKKPTAEKPKKQTLLELAKKRQPKSPPKENNFLENLSKKQSNFSKGFKPLNEMPKIIPSTLKQNLKDRQKQVTTATPEVETWASSDSDADVDSWIDKGKNFGSNSNLYPDDLRLSENEEKDNIVSVNPNSHACHSNLVTDEPDICLTDTSSLSDNDIPHAMEDTIISNAYPLENSLKNMVGNDTAAVDDLTFSDFTSEWQDFDVTQEANSDLTVDKISHIAIDQQKNTFDSKMLQTNSTEAEIFSVEKKTIKNDFKPNELNHPAVNHTKMTELGQEFEIKVKVKPDQVQDIEPDFFADMAPVIKSQNFRQSEIKPDITLKPLHNNAPADYYNEYGMKKSFAVNSKHEDYESTEVRSVDSGQGSSVSAVFHAIDDQEVAEDGWGTEDW